LNTYLEKQPPDEDGWLVNQSCLILRIHREGIDAIPLFMYLRSDLGQALLNQIVSGATTPLIQLKPLKNLTILIPRKENAQGILDLFTQQVQLQNQIKLSQQEHSTRAETIREDLLASARIDYLSARY